MRKQRPGKRVHGVHVVYTAVTDFDDALAIIRSRQRKKTSPTNTLKMQLGRNKTRQLMRPVTLSDRVVPRKKRPPAKRIGETVVWSKERIIAAWETKQFKIRDLALRGACSVLQIKRWCFGPQWRPTTGPWVCQACKHRNPAGDFYCGGCTKYWSEPLD